MTGLKVSSFRVVAASRFDLLEDGIGDAAGKRVAGQQQRGRRLAWATAAAVTMFVAPGPMELVATMICRRRIALA